MQLFVQVQTIPIGAFIGAALVLIPLPSHWRARNVATLSLIAWLFVVDMIYGINALVWKDNIEVRLVVWCDITTKIIIGSSSALPAATLCICKYLESVAATRMVLQTKQDKRRRMWFELTMCFGVPFMLMALHYVVQGHRFDIIESFGCQPATYISVPGIFVVWFPPLLLATVTLVYASLALYHFFMQRLTFTLHLQNTNSALTTGRYLRLIAMSITEITWGTSLTALVLAENVIGGLRPWTNWDDVHSNFSRIGRFALLQYPPYYLRLMILFGWAIPASSIIFFLFFGFSDEVMRDYKRILFWFRRRVLGQHVKEKSSPLSSLPTTQPRLVMKGFSDIDISLNLKDDDDVAPPCYNPAAIGQEESLNSPSKSEMMSDSGSTLAFTEISMRDLPVPSPTGSPPPAAAPNLLSQSLCTTSQMPSTMPLAPSSPLPSPPYRRPFSPPTICPVTTPEAEQFPDDVLRVTVRTEITHVA